jgi:hypothetical protein
MRTHPPVERNHRPGLIHREPVIIVLAAVVAVVLAVGVTRSPPRVERLSIRNGTPWNLNVEVGSSGDALRSPLPIALAGSTTTVGDVLDQGDRWTFEVRAGGVDAGRIAMTRSQLRDAGWTVTVPDSMAARLRDAGIDLPTS